MLPVDEVSMASDPDEYASLREKFRAWALRKAARKRRWKWVTGIVVMAISILWLYWLVHIIIHARH